MKTFKFMNIYRSISIRTKLITIFCMLVILPIIIIGFFSYQNYAKIMKEKFINYSQKNATELSALITERTEKLINFSQEILYDNKIYDANMELLSPQEDEAFSEYVFRDNMERYLRSILYSRSDSINIILFQFSVNKKVYYADRSYSNNADTTTPLNSIYKLAIASKGKPVWYLSQENGKVNTIYLARIVYDRSSLKEIGLLVFKVNEQRIFEVFSNFLANKTQNVGIYSEDNAQIFSIDTFKPVNQDSIKKLLGQNLPDDIHEFSVKNDKIYVIYNIITPLNWKLVISISSNVLLKEVRQVLSTVILLCIITIPVWVIMINLLYIDTVKPINLLIESMRKIEKGQIGVTVESDRNDELGYVFKTFNKMSLEINNLINSVYKKQLAIKDAEIKALQSQINPHFLYNTLETINWKAKLHGVEEISDMITALSAIMEANIDRNNELLIPLYKEIEYVDNYNLLIAKRFGRKIKFKKSVMQETLNCEIPRLIIQPLIENSVYHGLETKKGGGTIELITKIEEQALIIKVEDNGLGIEESMLDQLNTYISNISQLDDIESITCSSSKIGIMNVHKRVKLLYGEKYGLEISSEPGKGTTVTVRLPIRVHKGVKVYD